MHIYRNKCTGSLEITTVMSKGHSIESHLGKVHFYPVSKPGETFWPGHRSNGWRPKSSVCSLELKLTRRIFPDGNPEAVIKNANVQSEVIYENCLFLTQGNF